MQRNHRTTLSLLACFAVSIGLLTTPARAQLDQLDPNMLIDTLADEGMSELLLHLVETEPPSDPVVGRQIEIAQHRVRYHLPGRSAADRQQDLTLVTDLTRKLIEDFYDHEQRPLWQTDLAELLLIEHLRITHDAAQVFYEFGQTTAEQREAYERLVPEAFIALADADLRFFQLRGELPQDADHLQRRVNTGLWTRMIDEYYLKRTQFYLAQAALYTALLPDEHAYFASLAHGRHERVPDQQTSPDAERARLFALAAERAERFQAASPAGGDVALMSMSLHGRALARAGSHDLALEVFDRVLAANRQDLAHLEAALGRAMALYELKQPAEAMDLLRQMESHPLTSSVLYRLLVTDARHRLLLREAASATGDASRQAMEAAYEPYIALLTDPDLADQAEGLRNYVYRRWEANVDTTQNLADLPPIVRLGIGQVARVEGQNLARQAEGNLPAEAVERLERAIEVLSTLTNSDAPDPVQAEAMYNRAIAQYWLAPRNVGNLVRVATLMTDQAEQLPGEALSEQAIGEAAALLRALHQQQQPRPREVDQAYRRAGEVLFRLYPQTRVADNERLYYAFSVLQADGNWAQAAALYAGVPHNHSDYFEANRERLFTLAQLAAQATGEEADAAQQHLREAAERLFAEAEAVVQGGGEQRDTALRALAGARLMLSDLAKNAGDVNEALELLSGFEQQFAAHPELIRDALQRRIVALAEVGRMDEAADQSLAMMNAYPDDAAEVIDRVLTWADQELERNRTLLADEVVAERRTQLQQQAGQLASAASRLSELLLNWAQAQNYDDEQMLPFRLIRARSLRLAGEIDQAMRIVEPMMQTHGSDASVIEEYAETLFARTDEASLIQAAGHYDSLIRGLSATDGDLWWNAWMRRLQINDRMNRHTADIPLRIRQLRLTDENLGGPRFRPIFEQLENKHR